MNLLTGATGFVGGHVVEYLFQQNEISKAIFRIGSHLKILDLNGVQGVEADLLDHHSLHEAAEGTDAIYSMASPMPGDDTDFERVNTEGVSNLLEVASEMGVKSFIHLSTADVYGVKRGEVGESTPPNPADQYQRSKVSAERVLMEFSKRNSLPRIVVIRAAKAVGSRDETFVVPLLRMINRRKIVVPRGAEMSFTHPKDIAQAMYKAAVNQSVPGGFYLVKSFDATPEAFAKKLGETLGVSTEVRTAGLFSKSELPQYTNQQLTASLRFGPQESWKVMGYSPGHNLESTCSEIALWYKKEPWVAETA